jgi:small subunit ribosomal protein S11
MSQNTALRTFRSLLRTSHRSFQPTRCLTQTSTASAQPPPGAPKQDQTLDSLMSSIDSNFRKATPDYFSNLIPGQQPGLRNLVVSEWAEDDKHKLHIYATKQHTHYAVKAKSRRSDQCVLREHWLSESGARNLRCSIPAGRVRDEPYPG